MITQKFSTTPPSLPPQRGSPMPTSYSAVVQGFHAHTTPDFDPDPETCTSWRDYVRCMPTKQDFRMLIQEVRDTSRTEISMLRTDLHQLSTKVASLEEETCDTKIELSQIHDRLTSQASTLRNFQRHLEDLDNRGRRNNIRVRGLPEATQEEDLNVTLQAIFNSILGRPEHQRVKLDRAHRALRHCGPGSRPRDVICRMHNYTLKEDIMRKARNMHAIDFDGASIQLFPDLSWITLQQRRSLQPLLTLLREHDFHYHWGFPFSLTAKKDGRSTTLRYPEDLQSFCRELDIPVPPTPGWEPLPVPPPRPDPWIQVTGRKRTRPRSVGPSPPPRQR